MNLLLFNEETRQFDLSHLKQHIKEDNSYFKNFEEFYDKQLPLLSNAGDIDMRSSWGRVPGDLNKEGDLPEIRYLKGTYELDPGIVNLIHAFRKIFGLEIKAFPKNEGIGTQKKWLEESLTTLFETVNPTRRYEFDLSRLQKEGDDFSGNLKITAKDKKSNKALFSFIFYASVGKHSDVKELQVPDAKKSVDYGEELKTHPTTVKDGTAEETLWLLKPNIKKSQFRLYDLFGGFLTDNNARIKALEKIHRYYQEEAKPLLSENLHPILENILRDIPSENEEVAQKATPIVVELMKIDELQPIVSEIVKGFYVSMDAQLDDSALSPLFSHITHLFTEYNISNFTGLNIFKNLQELNLNFTESLEKLSVENLTCLKKLSLWKSGVTAIEGVNILSGLQELDLRDTTGLDKLVLEKLIQLKKLNLNGSVIKTITLNTLGLEELDLRLTPQLKEIFLENLTQLKKFSLSGSRVNSIKFVNTLLSLEELNLSSLLFLLDDEIVFENLTKLKTLNLTGLRVKSVKLSTLSSLEKVVLKDAPELKSLIIYDSAVQEIELENLAKFSTLDLKDVPRLKRIIFKGAFPELKNISFVNLPNLEAVDGLEDKILETLNRDTTPKLRKTLRSQHLPSEERGD